MKKQLVRLFEYNLWANKKFGEVLVAAPFKHPKILTFISHIHNAQLIWFDRINGISSETPVWAEYSIEEAIEKLRESSEMWIAHINQVEKLDQEISYHNSIGEAHTSVLSDIMTHVANHGTHHRGQLALLLREEGIAPPASDFIFFSRD